MRASPTRSLTTKKRLGTSSSISCVASRSRRDRDVPEGIECGRSPLAVLLRSCSPGPQLYFVYGLLMGIRLSVPALRDEADLVAAGSSRPGEDRHSPYGAARKMADAVQGVAELNHVSIDGAGPWRHLSLAKRIEILLSAEIESVGSPGLRADLRPPRARTAQGIGVAALIRGGISSDPAGKEDENRRC